MITHIKYIHRYVYTYIYIYISQFDRDVLKDRKYNTHVYEAIRLHAYNNLVYNLCVHIYVL